MASIISPKIDINRYLQNSKNKSYFVIAITVIFIVLVILVGILPAYSAVVSQSRENSKRSKVLDQLEAKITALRNLSTEFSSKKDIIGIFHESFPESDPRQELVVTDITDYIKKNNLYLESIAFSEPERSISLTTEFEVASQVDSQIVAVNLEGSRENILNFIRNLENSRRIYNLEGFVLTRKVGEELDSSKIRFDFKATMRFEIYYWTTDAKEDNGTGSNSTQSNLDQINEFIN